MCTKNFVFLSLFLVFVFLKEDNCSSDPTNASLSKLFNVPEDKLNSSAQNFTFSNITKSRITFFVFTPKNDTIPVTAQNITEVFSPDYPTKIITHGWESNATQEWVRNISNSYHLTQNCNVLAVDWSNYSGDITYIEPARATRSVGIIVGDFIVELLKITSLEKFHLVGHSLGAHVSGFAGKRVFNVTGKKVDRITGLDPAAPLFEIPTERPETDRLSPKDAEFVDVIHTQVMGFLGFRGTLGKVDFYPNMGIVQPDCLKQGLGVLLCGHSTSEYYFWQSIQHRKKYKGVRCKDAENFQKGQCNFFDWAYMGEGVRRNASGSYYLIINEGQNSK